jgi:hypothetical protein
MSAYVNGLPAFAQTIEQQRANDKISFFIFCLFVIIHLNNVHKGSQNAIDLQTEN